MMVYKDQITFNILDQPIHLISNETAYGLQTIAEINEEFHYLGNKPWDLSTAITVFERLNERKLTKEEISRILRDNNFTSYGI